MVRMKEGIDVDAFSGHMKDDEDGQTVNSEGTFLNFIWARSRTFLLDKKTHNITLIDPIVVTYVGIGVSSMIMSELMG